MRIGSTRRKSASAGPIAPTALEPGRIRRRVADHEPARAVGDGRVAALERRAQLVLLELGRRVHRRDVRAAAPEDAEVAEAAALAVEGDAAFAEGVDDPRHVEV